MGLDQLAARAIGQTPVSSPRDHRIDTGILG